MEKYTTFMDQKTYTVKTIILPKLIYKFGESQSKSKQ